MAAAANVTSERLRAERLSCPTLKLGVSRGAKDAIGILEFIIIFEE